VAIQNLFLNASFKPRHRRKENVNMDRQLDLNCVRSDVLTAVGVVGTPNVFWDVMACSQTKQHSNPENNTLQM
jgi:hypothetical protein